MTNRHSGNGKKLWNKPELAKLGTISDVAGKPPPLLQGSTSKS